MGGTVMHSANTDEVSWVVAATFGARDDVVDVEESGVGATWNAAAMLIAREDGTPHRGRDALLGASDWSDASGRGGTGRGGSGGRFAGAIAWTIGRAHVGVVGGGRRKGLTSNIFVGNAGQEVADVLPVASCHGHDLGADQHGLAAPELFTSAASVADGERDLIGGSAFILGSRQHVTSHREQHGIIVEPTAGRASQRSQGIAKQRKRLGRNLEAQHARAWPRRLRVLWGVARAPGGHELFELADGLALRGNEPGVFGFRHGHPRELAHGTPAHLTGVERSSELGQVLESLRDPQLFLSRADFVPEYALDIFGKAAMTEMNVDGRSKGTEQPASFFGVGGGPLASEPGERRVSLDPIAICRRLSCSASAALGFSKLPRAGREVSGGDEEIFRAVAVGQFQRALARRTNLQRSVAQSATLRTDPRF